MLEQGVSTRQSTGTNTIFFIPKMAVPAVRQVTYYGRIMASIRPRKQERHRICLTVVSDWLNYPGIMATHTPPASLLASASSAASPPLLMLSSLPSTSKTFTIAYSKRLIPSMFRVDVQFIHISIEIRSKEMFLENL
jgi:hypothetical protein